MHNHRFTLTFDVDWAPDYMIGFVADLLIERGIKSVWFWTHETPMISKLRSHSQLFEIGIHPNFLRGSSHGASVKEVFDHIIKIVPEAVSARSHGAFQSSEVLSYYTRNTRIKNESSQFLPEMPHISPVVHLTDYGPIRRFPIFWADDYELLKEKPYWSFERFETVPGWKVFLFHPVHVYLNTHTMAHYREIKKNYSAINSVPEAELKGKINRGEGIQTMLLSLMSNREFLKNNYLFNEASLHF